MCIAVFRSVGTVAPRALSGLTGTPAGYPRLAQRKSGRLCLGDTLRDTLRDTKRHPKPALAAGATLQRRYMYENQPPHQQAGHVIHVPW